MAKQVAIVGAGISGLLACKYALQKGFLPIVFEARSRIGGVWTQTLEITKLQTPKEIFQFSDFPWPPTVEATFPDHNQVLEYIEGYAKRFDLLRHVKFNSKVISIKYEGASEEEIQDWDLWGCTGEAFGPGGRWNVTVQDTTFQTTKIYEVEFVILCVGRYSDVPNIPEFPINEGPDVFDGKVLHAMEYSEMDDASAAELIEGKRVTVVGYSKSALDIASMCANANGVERPCTVVFRTERWNVPQYFPWLTYLHLNRFSELMIHKPGDGLLFGLSVTGLLSPLKWVLNKFMESYLKRTLPLKKYGMVPKHSFFQQMNSCLLSTLPNDFYDKVTEGSIILKKSESNIRFCKDGLVVNKHSITPIQSDIVILATGYRGDQKMKHIFASPFFMKKLSTGLSITDVPVLYRECIHPRIPQLAIIGYSESVATINTSELKCVWLVNLLDGGFKLPSIREMEKDMVRWEHCMKKYSVKFFKGSCISAVVWYNDQLCKDMGWKPRRKKGFLAEWFEPYGPLDYRELSP